ncbi:hypothetical protein ACF1GS_18445 [Streptomyces eurythermus]|uniref:hypothetical protein n=1 Tax=Streptomyces eurythermus TaxID=42237 RepID=UPI0036FC1028
MPPAQPASHNHLPDGLHDGEERRLDGFRRPRAHEANERLRGVRLGATPRDPLTVRATVHGADRPR